MNASDHRILVVEDEAALADGIRENLEFEGYRVVVARDGSTALQRLRQERFDMVVLDIMLPGEDGLTVCRTIRDEAISVPVLFLTARDSARDRIQGLEAGGDDYLAKPFQLEELLLRVAAILRRRSWSAQVEPVRFGDNEIDLTTQRARAWDGREHLLSERETQLVRVFSQNEGKLMTREEVLERVWGHDVFPSTRAVEQLVVKLRERFEKDPSRPLHLHSVSGTGYRWTRMPDSEGRSNGSEVAS